MENHYDHKTGDWITADARYQAIMLDADFISAVGATLAVAHPQRRSGRCIRLGG